MMITRRRPSKGRYAAAATTSRTGSILITPVSDAPGLSTSGSVPFAIRLHAAHAPQASNGRFAGTQAGATAIAGATRVPVAQASVLAPTGERQFSASATACATSLLPTPSGPVSYTHLRAHETRHDLVCRLL